MHEFSIAEALADQVLRHVPASGRVAEVEIRVGALRGLEPEALRMSWDAVTFGTPIGGSMLRIDRRPWTIACTTCGRAWEAALPFAVCPCGDRAPVPSATAELDLVAVTIDEDEAPV